MQRHNIKATGKRAKAQIRQQYRPTIRPSTSRLARGGFRPFLHLLLATLLVGRDGRLLRSLEIRFLHLVGVLPLQLLFLLAQFPAQGKLLVFREFLEKFGYVVVREFGQEYGEVESAKDVGDVEGLTVSVKEMNSTLTGVTIAMSATLGGVTFLIIS